MNSVPANNRRLGRLILWSAVLLLAAGCATTGVDWAVRVGNYTFDQAVVELGPPDKQAKLQDGLRAAVTGSPR